MLVWLEMSLTVSFAGRVKASGVVFWSVKKSRVSFAAALETAPAGAAIDSWRTSARVIWTA